MKFLRILIGVAVVVVSLCVLFTPACGKKADEKIAEKTMGKVLTEATGKETQVDLHDGNVHIENSDMKVDMASSSTWPADMFADVPKFTGGAIERVIASNADGARKFNIHYTGVKDDAVKRYTQDLKSQGWDANLMEMGGKAAILSAQKNNLGMSFTYSAEKKDGVLAVFSTQQEDRE
jgi:hypothetical protein